MAAVLENLNRLIVREVPEPEMDDNSALLRVEAAALCGSDLRIIRSGNPRVTFPAIIGHELAGMIVKAGKNVRRVKEGDRIALAADVPCGQCRFCRDGHGNNCAINHAIGYQIPGGFAQLMRLPPLVLEHGPVAKIPGSLSFEGAALAEPLACVVNGLEVAGMALGKTLAIIGMGPIGCMMIDMARHMGAAKIIAIRRNNFRGAFADRYAADAYIDPDSEDMVARCLDETGGEGADAVITACASVDIHEQALEMVARRGVVNLFGGLPADTRPMNVKSNLIHYKECVLTGSHGSVPRQHNLAVQLIATEKVRVAPLISHRFPLTRINEAIEIMMSKKAMKIIIAPWEKAS